MGIELLGRAIRRFSSVIPTREPDPPLEISVPPVLLRFDGALRALGTPSLPSLADHFLPVDVRVAEFLQAAILSNRDAVHDASQKFYRALIQPERLDLTFDFEKTGDILSISIRKQIRTVSELLSASAALNNYCDELLSAASQPLLDRHPAVIEALSLAVIRHLCIGGEIEAAHGLTRKLLMITRKTIHLRAVEAAVARLLKQEPVPDHLARFVTERDSALTNRFCQVPFARADVHQGGEVLACCAHWLPTPIGNVFDNTAEAILNSEIAKDIRRSVVDGSFKYCSHADCETLVNNKLPYKKDFIDKDFDDEYYHIDQKALADAFAGTSFDLSNISYLIFCLDRTCNLSCPSCRVDVIMVKGEERDRLYDATERGVLPMLKNAKRVMVNPSGEAFVSRPSRRLLEKLADPGYENLIVDIITNGSVCDKEAWDKFSHLYGRIHILRVSIDGATKGTIEKLRRLIKYDTLVENLENLARMHKAGHFKHFFVSFTYQRDNVLEMEAFVEFAARFGVSTVIFERLQNIGTFTPEEYTDRAVHLVDHPMHADFLKMVRKVKQHPQVYIDFSL